MQYIDLYGVPEDKEGDNLKMSKNCQDKTHFQNNQEGCKQMITRVIRNSEETNLRIE